MLGRVFLQDSETYGEAVDRHEDAEISIRIIDRSPYADKAVVQARPEIDSLLVD